MPKRFIICLALMVCIFCVFFGCGNKENSDEITLDYLTQNIADSTNEKTDIGSEDNNIVTVDNDKNKNELTSVSEVVYSNETENTNTDSTISSEGRYEENTTQKMEEDIFTVTFKDYDRTVLKTEKVKKGASATAPENPEREGYRFVKWNIAYDNVNIDIVTTATYEKIVLPTIIVKDVFCSAGDTVTVKVSVMNNPGILGMLMNILYDENVMKLKKVENGQAMSDYMFIPPRNMKTGCNAAWSTTDIPESVCDGEIMVLHFAVDKKASKGTYPITVSCLNNAFDDNYNSIAFDVINGSVTIK